MAVTNPNIMSMVPGGGNPTGTNIGAAPGMPASQAQNPYTLGMVPGGATGSNFNPYSFGGMPGATTAVPGSAAAGQNFSGAFGNLGPAISQMLSSGGGYNPQAVQAILAQMQPGNLRGAQNVAEQFGAAGAGSSDAAASGLAQYWSQVGLNQNDIMAQMYMQGYQNYMNQILNLAGPMEQYQQSRPTAWDIIGGILGDAASVLGGPLGKSLFNRGGGGGGGGGGVSSSGSFADPGVFTSTTPYSSLPGAEAGFGTGWLPGMQYGPYSSSPTTAATLGDPSANVYTSWSPLVPTSNF